MDKHPHIARFLFHGALCDFPGIPNRPEGVTLRFGGRPSVKDLIEAQGVPHVEVDAICRNGKRIDFSVRVHDGDRVEVFADAEKAACGDGKKLKPLWEGVKKFILDGHLGTLARDLRLLGIDTAYDNDASDSIIISRAEKEHRIILTRDIGLLRDGAVRHARWIRHTDPDAQLKEILLAYDLESEISPFSRCLKCNGRLQRVGKDEIRDCLPLKVRRHMQEFDRCTRCGQIYWKGTHYEKLMEKVRSILNR